MVTKLVNDRVLALRMGYEATDWINPISFDKYCTAMRDWTVQAIVRDDLPIGSFFKKDDEVHVSVLPEWRRIWATKGLLREIFNGAKISTRVTEGHRYMYGILSRLGFKEVENGLLVKEN